MSITRSYLATWEFDGWGVRDMFDARAVVANPISEAGNVEADMAVPASAHEMSASTLRLPSRCSSWRSMKVVPGIEPITLRVEGRPAATTATGSASSLVTICKVPLSSARSTALTACSSSTNNTMVRLLCSASCPS